MRIRNLMVLALAPVVLAACNDDPAGNDDRTASGQVLEGSASDAMIPLEQLKSQPPLARDRPAGEAGEAEATAEGTVDEAASDAGPGDNPLFADDGTPL